MASPDRERIGAEVAIGVVSRTRVGVGVAVGGRRVGSATGVWTLAGSNRPSPARPMATSVAGRVGCALTVPGASGVIVARCGVTCAVGIVTMGVSGVGGGGPAGVDEAVGCSGAAPGAMGRNPTGRRVGHGVGCHGVGVTAGVGVGALKTTWPGGT